MIRTTSKILGIALSLSLVCQSPLHSKQEPAPPFEPTLPWLSDFDEAIAAAKKSGKPILVEFR